MFTKLTIKGQGKIDQDIFKMILEKYGWKENMLIDINEYLEKKEGFSYTIKVSEMEE